MSKIDRIEDVEPYTEITMEEAIELGVFEPETRNDPALYTITGEPYESIKTYCRWFAGQRVKLMQKAFSQNQNPELKFWMQSRHHALAWYLIMEAWFERKFIIKTDLWNGLPCSTATSQNIIRDAIDLQLVAVLSDQDGRKDRVFPTRKTLAAFISYCNFTRYCGKRVATKINGLDQKNSKSWPIVQGMDEAVNEIQNDTEGTGYREHLKRYFKDYV
tara:strand:- start:139 stop:789 length:651 start_codon:yes stop_codon:yes gene_type:complete